jgi:hypothetical protein
LDTGISDFVSDTTVELQSQCRVQALHLLEKFLAKPFGVRRPAKIKT